MESFVTLSVARYAGAIAGGFALGTLFGRKLGAELKATVHAVELRLTALETALHISHAEPAAGTTAHAIQAQAAATEKLAAALATAPGAPKA